MRQEIQAVIESYEAGTCAKGSAFTDLLYLTPSLGVQAVLDDLPAPWREEFTSWLVEHYDNDEPVEEYLAIGLSEEEEKIRNVPIPLVRAWLNRRRSAT